MSRVVFAPPSYLTVRDSYTFPKATAPIISPTE